MAVRVKEVLECLSSLAPVERKMDFDNVGLLVGSPEAGVTCVLAALDVTEDVIEEASSVGAELIIAHHPVIFGGLKAVRTDDPTGRRVTELVRRGVAAICMHTNLDVSRGGVNDALAERLGVKTEGVLAEAASDGNGEYGLGRWGSIGEERPFCGFLAFVKSALGANGLRYVDAGRPVRKVAVCGGSGGSELAEAAALGCDTFVTADVKYSDFLNAVPLNVNLIDAGHFPTENVVVSPMANCVAARFPELRVEISAVHGQAEKFFV